MKLGLPASLLIVSLLAACSNGDVAVTDGWIGRWNGPEGTYLDIKGGNGTYQVTIKNLDAARSFDASAAAKSITFERDGMKDVIRATNGIETGMKWLADKQDCLTVRPGEGYCRN